MRLKKATLFVLAALVYFFCLRALGTLFPEMFRSPWAVKPAAALSLFFSLAPLLFFMYFHGDHVRAGQTRLKRAAAWAIFGSALVVFMYLRSGLEVFRLDILYVVLQSSVLKNVMPVVPWVAGLLVFIFFVIYSRDGSEEDRQKLKKAILMAVVGSALSFFVHTFIILNYFTHGRVRWFADLSGAPLVVGFLFVAAAFLLNLYFFTSFYKERDLF